MFEQRHQPDSTLKYALLYADANVKYYNQANAEALMQMNSLYDYGVEQKIAQEEKEKSEQKSRWIGLLVIAVLSALSLLLYVFYKKAKKEKQLSELNLQINETNGKLQQAERALYMHEADKENYQQLMAESEDTISRLEETVQQLERERNKLLKRSAEKNLSTSKAVASLNHILANPTPKNLDFIDWTALKSTVEENIPSFYSALNSAGNLTATEYRLCLLVKTGFTPSQIEILLGLMPKYASTLRRRLLKKVFGEEGTASDFDRKVREIR